MTDLLEGVTPRIIRVLDTETTGFPPNASMVEIAWTDIIQTGGEFELGRTHAHLLKPRHPIHPKAMAVHHITEDMVKDAPSIQDIRPHPNDGSDIFSAHNVEFDSKFFNTNGKPWLCTLKAARRVWPDAPTHTNQGLRYWLDLQFEDPARTLPVHSAGPDTYVTAHILLRLLKEATIEEMMDWASKPSLLSKCNFKKHKDVPWKEVPSNYLWWVVREPKMNADVKYTANHWLKQRGELL